MRRAGGNDAKEGKKPWKHGSNGKIQKVSEQLQEQRRNLPIAKGADALIREIKSNDTLVLLGETGSGKTTQVPQYILESGVLGSGMIAVTQPRRVAATSLAARVAAEQGCSVGDRVGYAVRFQEAYGPETKIKFLTDGMLARELLADPLLSKYSVIILDEAHERTLNTDLLMASLKGIQEARKGNTKVPHSGKGKERADNSSCGALKVIIMSATLDAEKFSRFFGNAKIIYVKGRQHPVKIYHTVTGQNDFVDAALRTFFQIHVDQPPGDVLIFLPGQEDIESLEKSISSYASQLPLGKSRVVVCPFYASMPQDKQNKVFSPTTNGQRKCILSTNIAETSITIPGVRYVIDTGVHKEKRHLAGVSGSGFNTLLVCAISKSSAMQRAGRAGREGPGFCYRLYPESAFRDLPDTSEPEIMRCSLASATLRLKCLQRDFFDLELLDKPDGSAINAGMKTLWMLGALDTEGNLTPTGRAMSLFPVEPQQSRALLESRIHGCTREVLAIVAIQSASSKVFYDPGSGSAADSNEPGSRDIERRDQAQAARAKFIHISGDHMTLLNVFRAYEDLLKSSGGDSKSAKAERRDWCNRHFLHERALTEALDIQTQLRRICDTMRGREASFGLSDPNIELDWRSSVAEGPGSTVEAEKVLKCLMTGLVQHGALRSAERGYCPIMDKSKTIKIHPSSTLAGKKFDAIMYDELLFTNSGSTYARCVSAIPTSIISDLSAYRPRST
ncbi:P-loop containing nucleoside triphosphate hydrolase protein [Schizopora paradoxa]|uniref:RNA helicase n=1 Tax=Schizopora paradoxa TaxID=27342 RepID=A0A0H2RYV7_9AGAM|nr:P-loop containing nucleoside triphosphate hydrolase protein [Schizopora paradoxa]